MSTETTPKRSGRKGRPNNPVEYRRRLAQLACEPGVSVARVAIEHGLNTNLLFKWRRAYLAGEYDAGTLMPVSVVSEVIPSASPAPSAYAVPIETPSPCGVMEIIIGAARVRIEGAPDASTLRLVLQSLRSKESA